MKVRQLHNIYPLRTWLRADGKKHPGAFWFRFIQSSPVLSFTNIVVNMER
jgi:hypothetical protein